jgi:hypothetical protein
MSKLDDCSDVENVVQGESLVIRRSLSVHVCEEDVEQQKENIFHTRCYIDNKICNMIFDNGSYTNVVSSTLVRKLNLNLKHLSMLNHITFNG